MDVCEVDEGVTDVGGVLEVDAKVHEVVGAEASVVEDGLESELQERSVVCRGKRRNE